MGETYEIPTPADIISAYNILWDTANKNKMEEYSENELSKMLLKNSKLFRPELKDVFFEKMEKD